MPDYDSHHHVVKTTAQWKERAVEYWVVPRGCLCVELTPEHKTKLKVGEGNKYYAQLPYICEGHDLEDYYTKEEVDRLLDNLNRMAIQSTDEYDSKDDLPLDGNKLGDVRFVKSASPEIKIDPDVYLWNGDRWIFVGYDLVEIDLSQYLKKEEFHSYFDPVSEKVDEMYPKMHTHENKSVLDQTERPYTIADKEKLDSLHNYDDTEIRELIEETGHTHWNKNVLDTITPDSLWTVEDRTKFESLHNYDDSELRGRVNTLESKAHTHTNKDILDQTTAPFKTEDKQKLDSLENYDVFVGTDGRYPGIKGLVPAPSVMDIGKFLSSSGEWELAGINTPFVGATPTTDGVIGLVPAPLMGEQSYYLRGDGTWSKVKVTGDKYKAGEGIYILSGEVTSDTFPFKLYAKGGFVQQYIIYGAPGGVGDYNSTTGKYHIPVEVSAEGHTSITTVIQVNDPLYENDWINYETQEYCVSKTNLTNTFQNIIAIEEMSGIDANGNFNKPPGRWPQFAVSDYYEIESDAQYELPPMSNFDDVNYYQYANVNMYDENYNRTRTILRGQYSKVIITPLLGEKYLRVASSVTIDLSTRIHYFIDPVLYRLKEVINPVPSPLEQIQLIPNTINTIDVLTTTKPLDVYMETVMPEEPDPDDPMSEYTGIIYNEGVLDITQEDPNALNELTVHFRDDVSKTLTIPSEELVPATTTTLGGIIVGKNLTIDEDGVLDAKSAGDKYKAGEGIYILSGEVTSDTFPFEIFAKASRTSQYVIYGSAAGVGDWDGTNYTLSITTSAPGETTLTTQILYNARLYSGDYVDYSRQIIHHSKQDMRQYISLYNHSTYGTSGTFQTNTGSVIGNYNSYTGVTNYIEVNPGEIYLIKAFVPYGGYDTYYSTYHCIFDENHALTRYFNVLNAGAVTIEIQPGEKYARFVGTPSTQMLQPGFVYKLEGYEEPCVLPSIVLYPNKINTIGVSNTNKPSEIYFEAISDEPIDPDDPMSEYTGIIYNDGIIDVTQEDPNALNELTFHYRDDVDKTITIPTSELPIATDSTLGGIKVGTGLEIDPTTGVLSATGGGGRYIDGDGIEFTYDHMIDKLFDRTVFLDRITSVQRGTISKDTTTGAFTITATGDDAYTWPDRSSLGTVYSIQADPFTTYKLTWTSSDPTVHGNVFAFENGDITTSYLVDQATSNELIFTTSDTCQSLNFRFGVQNTGDSLTYSAISLYEIDGYTTINAKLGNGLHFDENGAIEADAGVEYTAGDAISIEHPQISSTITHVKWVLLDTRDRTTAGDIVQVGEFELYDTDDQLLTYSSISATFGNGGTPTYGTNQYQQTPDKLIDGDTNLKMCCTNFTTSCGGLEITMELMDSIDIRDIKQYRYITCYDWDARDPVTWDFYVSSDGTDWTLVDSRENETIPTARETSTTYYEITHPTSDELAIGVKYGNGLRLDANGALEVVPGGGLTAGHGIEIDQTNHINDKLGVGLTFDNNDAVTLDETTDLVFNCDYSE